MAYLAGAGRDISNHIKDGFEFTAWAIGTCSLNQGDLVPIETEYAFELDLANADVLTYVQQSLDIGQLNFAIVGQHPAFGGATDYPTYFCREAGLGAAHLEITLADGLPGDIDGDGDVDQSDLGILLAAYSSCEGDEYWNPDADLDGNGCVDQSDLGILLANYGL